MNKLLFSIILMIGNIAYSQELLVNGGFEEENICTEYKINCAPEAWISNVNGIGNYITDHTRAYEGLRCMAIEAGHSVKPYQRTFIRSQLLCALRKGNTYKLEFFIKSPHAILDSIGVYFGEREPLLERKPVHLLFPAVFLVDSKSSTFKKDSSWQKVTIDYVAKGGEVFITIANFSRNDINGNTGIKRENKFFVFTDAISLVPADKSEQLCDNWKTIREEIVDLNERHHFLQHSVKQKQVNGPLNLPLRLTMQAKSDTLLLSDVLFATGKKDLHATAFTLLDKFCQSLNGKAIDSLVIEGHTDSIGKAAFNQQLSLDRAVSTAKYLQNCSWLSTAKIVTKGWGSQKPVSSNKTIESRQRNRRVQLIVYFRE
jgi:outer membrane protein OmpA-like peptidoglycan-associated protein